MSTLLAELIAARKKQQLSYEKYLQEIVKLAKQVEQPLGDYPTTIDTPAKQALYDNLKKDEGLALNLHHAVMETKKAYWRGNRAKEGEIEEAIADFISDDATIDRIFELVKKQHEY